MSGITLTHVPSQHTRGWLAAAAAVILMVVAVGGYGLLNRTDLSGAGTHPTSTPALTGGPGPSPSAGVTPRPSGLSLDVLASATCSETSPGTRTETPNVVHIRNATKTCSMSGVDRRLIGKMSISINSDDGGVWFGAPTWGRASLRTDDGLWAGVWYGSSVVRTQLDGFFIGSEGYDGLRLRYRLTATDASGYGLVGTLESTDVIPPDGSLTILSGTRPTMVDPGTQTVGKDVTRVRDVLLSSDTIASDTRLIGTSDVTSNYDEHVDGSANAWGTEVITGPPGTWMSRWTRSWTGTIDAGESTQHLTGAYVGSGYWGGLRFEAQTIGTADTVLVTYGTIVAAGQ